MDNFEKEKLIQKLIEKVNTAFTVIGIILIIISILLIFACLFTSCISSTGTPTYRFELNDGESVSGVSYSVIIDKETGYEYLYFKGKGVTPFIDENGNHMRIVE